MGAVPQKVFKVGDWVVPTEKACEAFGNLTPGKEYQVIEVPGRFNPRFVDHVFVVMDDLKHDGLMPDLFQKANPTLEFSEEEITLAEEILSSLA